MVWRPFMRQMREIVETLSILGTRIEQWMVGTAERICTIFTRQGVWSFARTSLNVKVKSQRSRSAWTKTRCALTAPGRYIDGMERPRCR